MFTMRPMPRVVESNLEDKPVTRSLRQIIRVAAWSLVVVLAMCVGWSIAPQAEQKLVEQQETNGPQRKPL